MGLGHDKAVSGFLITPVLLTSHRGQAQEEVEEVIHAADFRLPSANTVHAVEQTGLPSYLMGEREGTLPIINVLLPFKKCNL